MLTLLIIALRKRVHVILNLFAVDTWNHEIFMVELPLLIPTAAPRLERKLNWMFENISSSMFDSFLHSSGTHTHTHTPPVGSLHLARPSSTFTMSALGCSSSSLLSPTYHTHKTHTFAHVDICVLARTHTYRHIAK